MTNLANLFNFIESNRPEYRVPLKFKLMYDPESITEDDLNVDGNLNLNDTPITSLPNNLTVGGSLDLRGTKIETLPDNLTVGGSLDLSKTNITSLPDNLTVGKNLDISWTPLSNKYSDYRLRIMIKDKGGNIGSGIVKTNEGIW